MYSGYKTGCTMSTERTSSQILSSRIGSCRAVPDTTAGKMGAFLCSAPLDHGNHTVRRKISWNLAHEWRGKTCNRGGLSASTQISGYNYCFSPMFRGNAVLDASQAPLPNPLTVPRCDQSNVQSLVAKGALIRESCRRSFRRLLQTSLSRSATGYQGYPDDRNKPSMP